MRYISLLLLLLAVPCQADVPKLFRVREFSSVDLANAVNHYVALGKDRAVLELQALDTEDGGAKRELYSRTERATWVCRILFDQKHRGPLRVGHMGILSLPWSEPPLDTWLRYPVIEFGSTYYVLSEGLIGTGMRESLRSYVAYCELYGRFRTAPIPVPTRRRALQDVANLRASKQWKAIKWTVHEPDFDCEISEPGVFDYLRKQAERVKR